MPLTQNYILRNFFVFFHQSNKNFRYKEFFKGKFGNLTNSARNPEMIDLGEGDMDGSLVFGITPNYGRSPGFEPSTVCIDLER